jgi:nucleoid-associated protein YgaU
MIRTQIITLFVAALASGLAAVAVVATFTDSPPAGIATPADASERAAPPEPRWATTRGCSAASSPTTGAIPAGSRTREARDERYLVRPGDTLWGLAIRYYEDEDAAAAMKRIKRRNGFRRDKLLAGEILVLPAVGRKGDGSRANESCWAGEAATDDAALEP